MIRDDTQHQSALFVFNQTRGTVLCERAAIADTMLTRLFGLLGKRELMPGTGLLIRPSSGVHTWGMTFPLDIVALDRKKYIVGIWHSVGPHRVRGVSLKTHSVLELAAGSIRDSGSRLGDVVQMSPVSELSEEEA